MSIEIRVHSKFSSRVNRARLLRNAQRALHAENSAASATIYLTTDAEIRKFNRQFHATNSATDVLAFPFNSIVTETRFYIGDVVISYDTAKRQASRARWSIADELDLLVVHGILHLLGYDDRTPRKRAQMWKQQEEILGRKIDG